MNFEISNLTNYCMNYTNQQSKSTGQNSGVDFNNVLCAKRTDFTETTNESKIEEYTEYLRSKYGNVTIQSVGKDQASLERAGKSMSGNDVMIAPNILEQMANDSEKGAYYEKKIEDFFDAVPQLRNSFASKGLDYQPCGVVIHGDGSVTYISGCGDSPERVAEVNAINKAKREKETEHSKELVEYSQKEAEQQRQIIERTNQMQILTETLYGNRLVSEPATKAYTSSEMVYAVSSYKNNVDTFSKSMQENIRVL